MHHFSVELTVKMNGSILHIHLFVNNVKYHNTLHEKLTEINKKYSHPWLGHGAIFYSLIK